MTRTPENTDQPRKERLEGLVHMESKITEAAEAAASAAAHAVEATKAAEAASRVRLAKKAEASKSSKAASDAKAAKAKAAHAASSAKALSEETQPDSHVLELRLTGGELDEVERVAAKQGLDAPALARSLLVKSLADDESQ